MVAKNGFTLIELMIVVAIVGILAAIAYPNYRQYVERTHRTDVQSHMLKVAHDLQRFYTVRQTYQGVSIVNVGGANYPKTGTQLYSIQLRDNANKDLTAADANGQTWEMRAIPLGVMEGNGIICLNHLGYKYWKKGADDCDLSPSSNWDGR